MSDPYSAARQHVSGVAASLNLPAAAAERLAWKHEAAMVLNPSTGAMAYLDGSRDTAEWLRDVERSNPAMLNKSISTTVAAPTASSAADLMTQVRTGTLSPEEAASRLLANQSLRMAPKPAGELNFTTLMARARSGDTGALSALQSMVRTSR